MMAIKVLLVEDDRALREALADTLLLAGHDYRAVGSAEDALEAVEQESFSLVVSDVNMTGMDGHQLLGLLRVRQKEPQHLLRRVDSARIGVAAACMAARPRMSCTVQHPVLRHRRIAGRGGRRAGGVCRAVVHRARIAFAAR